MQPACALDAQHLGSAISATNWQQSLPLEGSAAGSFFVPSVAAVLPAEAHLAAAAGMAFPQWPPLMALGMGVGGSMDFHEQQHLYYRGTGYLREDGEPPPPPHTHTSEQVRSLAAAFGCVSLEQSRVSAVCYL